MQTTISESDVLNLINGLVLPRKSFDFTPNGDLPSDEKPPITRREGIDDIVNALLSGREQKSNPEWVEALDRWWAREHAATIIAFALLKERHGREYTPRYEDYLPGRHLMYKRLVDDAILSFMPDIKNRKVAEIGSGSGISLTMLAREGAIAHAFDISETALGFFKYLARQSSVENRIRTKKGDFYQIDFSNDEFDLAYNVGVFEHRTPKERIKLLEEMKRITIPGGYIMIAVPNLISPHYKKMREREESIFQKFKQYMYPERDFHDVDPRELLTEAGLDVLKHDYVLIAPSAPIGRKVIHQEDYEFFMKLPNINGGNIPTAEKIKIWELLEARATPLQRQRYGWFVYSISRKS